MKTIPIFDISRSCNGCTACCDGWLTGEAYGHAFWPGRKCHYISSDGCSIYDQRPEDPCKTFTCTWLNSPQIFPEWLKPSLSGVIFSHNFINGIPFIQAVEAGRKMDSGVLAWLFTMYVNKTIPNIVYQVEGGIYFAGEPDFVEAWRKIQGIKIKQ